MTVSRKEELKEQYKTRKPQMGIIAVTCKGNGETFLGIDENIPSRINRTRFQLEAGNHPNKKLQGLWNMHGAKMFSFDVFKRLDDQDPGEDHREALEELLEICLMEHPDMSRIWKAKKRR